jgi:hypothetical protein
MSSLLVQLNVPLVDVPVGPVVRHWFAESFRRLGSDLRRRLLGRTVPPANMPMAESNVGGPIGDVWAYYEVGSDPAVGYSDDNYQRFLSALSNDTRGASFSIGVATATPLGPDCPLLAPPLLFTTFVVDPEDPRIGWFKIQSDISTLTGSADIEGALLALVRETASACGVIDGGIDARPTGTDRRQWLLLLSDEVGERLGGVEALKPPGLFNQVSRLPRGGYWLQATPRFNDLDKETSTRVAEVGLQAELIQRGLPTPYGLADGRQHPRRSGSWQ